MSYQPVFLIGAARSGTKILRDTISTHPEIEKIGYDINFIWKRYNENIPHDELGKDNVNSKFERFIKRYFNSKAKNKQYLIEKTVGNTLRIPFLLEVFPDAKFIILYRDGRDVVESVVRQWGQAPDNNYLFKKLFSVPFLHVLPFLFQYGIDTLKIKSGMAPRKKYVWGVRHKNWEKDLETDTLLEFCSKQWNYCIQSIIDNKNKIDEKNRIEIYYEKLVANPSKEFNRIAEFLNLNVNDFNYSSIKDSNVGKSKSKLTEQDYSKLNDMLKNNLEKTGYV